MPPIDPALIAAILAIVLPMILECLANGKTDPEIAAMLQSPNRRQRFILLVALPRELRKKLRAYWKENPAPLDEELAVELVEIAKEEMPPKAA